MELRLPTRIIVGALKIDPLDSQEFRLTFGALLLVDFAFVAAHLLWDSGAVVGITGYRINFGDYPRIRFSDHGYGELWEGIKGIITSALFLGCFLYKRRLAYVALAGIFALPHVDNFFRFHERVGGRLAIMLDQHPSSLIAQMAELAGFACIGVIALAAFAVSYRRSDAETRKLALIGLGIMVLLAGFAVGIDLAHSVTKIILKPAEWVDTLFILLEEGGEMMTISFGLAFSFAAFRKFSI